MRDPDNIIFVKKAEKPFPNSYNNLKNYIVLIHVNDTIRANNDQAEPCCIGTEEIG